MHCDDTKLCPPTIRDHGCMGSARAVVPQCEGCFRPKHELHLRVPVPELRTAGLRCHALQPCLRLQCPLLEQSTANGSCSSALAQPHHTEPLNLFGVT